MEAQNLATKNISNMRPADLRNFVRNRIQDWLAVFQIHQGGPAACRIANSAFRSPWREFNRLILVVPESQESFTDLVEAVMFAQPRNQCYPSIGVTPVECNFGLVCKHVDEGSNPFATLPAKLAKPIVNLAQVALQASVATFTQ
jgi:hypothetical protein